MMALSLGGLLATGCATGPGARPAWSELAAFPQPGAVPRLAVYGGLNKHLPKYRAVSALESFLYGPHSSESFFLRNPQGMTMLGERILVCDQGLPDVVAIDLNSGKTAPWCDQDHRPRCPVDITTDGAGQVFVADTTVRAVLVYEAGGKFVEELTPGEGPAGGFRPCGLAVGGDVLYVGNLDARRLERFDLASGAWLSPFSPPAGSPSLVAPTGVWVTPEDVILIADAVRGVVHRVTTLGRWLEALGSPGRGPGQFVRPKQVCCTASGLILVSDAGRQSVLVLDAQGRHFAEIREAPEAWEGWTLPMGLLLLDSASVQSLTVRAAGGMTLPDQCVIVSDSLGKPSLTLLGLVERGAAEVAYGS